MANPPNAALRAELVLALDKLQPQIRGLEYFNRFIPSTSEFLPRIRQELGTLVKRRELIQAVVNALDAAERAKDELDKDDYPNINKVQIPRDLFDELKSSAKELDAAEALFELEAMVTEIAIVPGIPADKK